MYWGLTPAIDFLSEMESKLYKNNSEINLLVVGGNDARHILLTMAKWYTHNTEVKLNFYVSEMIIEQVAKQLLLLLIALEPEGQLGPCEKVRLWMEVYANILLRPNSAEYVQNKAVQLVHATTDPDFLVKRFPCVRLDKLKCRERDSLENVFQFWTKETWDVEKSWDTKQRNYLDRRYDTRVGVYDWDYHMKIREIKGASVIGPREYKQWRKTGVAFLWLETEATVPNKTLSCGIQTIGDSFHHLGYMGDILYGPYYSFGLSCEDKKMLDTCNKIYKKRSTDIFERNIMRTFHEIEKQEPYVHQGTKNEMDLGLAIVDIGRIKGMPEVSFPIKRAKEEYSTLPVPHSVVFLPLRSHLALPTKKAYKGFFHLLYLSLSTIQNIDPELPLCNVLVDGAIVIMESRKFVFNMTDKGRKDYDEKIKKLAENWRCQLLGSFDLKVNNCAIYQHSK